MSPPLCSADISLSSAVLLLRLPSRLCLAEYSFTHPWGPMQNFVSHTDPRDHYLTKHPAKHTQLPQTHARD